jgi:large subunit ribosomal protein L9
VKVLFLHDVLNVADAGQVKDVADGYARNYLLPRNLAVAATKGQQKMLEQHMQAIERRREKELERQRAVAAEIDGTVVRIIARVGEANRLYGSVTTADIATALQEATGHPVDRRKIDLTEPIKATGEHPVTIKYSRDITATVTVVVEGEPVA